MLRAGPTESLIQGLHQSLFRAEKRIGTVLFGKGNIGSRWLELFAREQTTLSARTGFEFILAGVVDSRRSLLNYEGLDASRALAFFNDEAIEQDEESLFLWMRAHPYDDLVVLDVTASAQLADQYRISPATASTLSARISWLAPVAAVSIARSTTRSRRPGATGCTTPPSAPVYRSTTRCAI